MVKKSNKIGIELDDFHYHEAIDRIMVTIKHIDQHLIQHPFLKLETEVKDLVVDGTDKLWLAYQKLAELKANE
jgi:hypothetical protein